MKRFLLVAIFAALSCASFAASSTPEYSIQAIRYASAQDDVANLVMGAPHEKISIAMVIWLIRGGGHNILFDSGYHRDTFLKEFPSTDYIRPDQAVKLAGIPPEDITDIVISHAHWDHMGGMDLFPKATIWIQKEEFRYYTDDAWQTGGDHGGIDPEDVQELVKRNTEGRLRLVDGDNAQLFPGIRAYTGGRHTYASQYLCVEGNPPFVLASDNLYLYRNLVEHKATATFSDADHAANIRNQYRMVQLAGSPDRVVPGHDALQFQRFPTHGRVARIKG
jgi:glyoxylase-like metal-dependent hydrolase (beta-lactamase superfamily II)